MSSRNEQAKPFQAKPLQAKPFSVKRAALAATVGNMLEFYDFITYSFFAIQIGHTFFPTGSEYGSLMLSLATFGAGFVTRPIGGIVLGIYSDRIGRRPAMLLSFALMGAAILTITFTPSYTTIGIAAPIIVIAARMVQGFALGGEVGPTTAYLIEIAPPEHRALVVAWQPASQEIAATAGALVGVILSKSMAPETLDAYGWRVAFLIGTVCLPFGVWMRRTLPETIPRAEAGAAAKESTGHFSQAHRHTGLIVLALMVLASGTISTYVTQYMTTYAQNTLHVSSTLAFAVSLVSNGIQFAGALVGGWLADRLGRKPVMIWPQLATLLLTYPVFLWIVHAPARCRSWSVSVCSPSSARCLSRHSMRRSPKRCHRTSAAVCSPPSMQSRSRASAARRSSWSPGCSMSPVIRWRRPGICCLPGSSALSR